MQEKTPYKKITFDDVWIPRERSKNLVKSVNEAGNRITGNDFIDCFAILLKQIGYARPHRYSDSMGIAEPHFFTVVVALTGYTPRDWIDEFVRRSTVEILSMKGRSTPLYEIACSLGFCTQETFNRFIRKHFKMTPGELRDSLQKR